MTHSTSQKRKNLSLFIFISINLVGALILLSACSQTATPEASLHGHLLVEGSTALQPLTTIAASLFEKRYSQVQIEVRGGGSLVGLDTVTKQQADIGNSDIYADPALYPDPNLTDHIVCIIPFTMISNLDITLPTLKQEEIIDIFVTGKLYNWSQLGGPNLPIVPVIRADTSGTRASFLKYVLDGKSEKNGLQKTNSSQEMLNFVARTPGAIGYMGLPSLNAAKVHVHTLAINGVASTPAAIASGKYAFWGYEHMYTMSNNLNSVLTPFLQFMLTPTVQEQAQHMGYIPLDQVHFSTPTPQAQGSNSSTVNLTGRDAD